jgi:hypothetical protein
MLKCGHNYSILVMRSGEWSTVSGDSGARDPRLGAHIADG